jgi:hypothetical protein
MRYDRRGLEWPGVPMPMHDWTRVGPGIFHHFHHAWIFAISNALNGGLLPSGYYALAEQMAGGFGPDVLTLDASGRTPPATSVTTDAGSGVALATAPPQVRYHARSESDQYARKAKSVVVRHASDHRVIAVAEIVSPGNKAGRLALRQFVEKAQDLLSRGIHLLIVDPFPPGTLDPQGLHKLIWDYAEDSYLPIPDRPLTLAAYVGGDAPEAFVEPTAVGLPLVNMPLFLTPETYVPVPLEPAYQVAWEAVPAVWREVLDR